MLCEQKLQEFVHRRGLATWDYRLIETEPVPDTIRYRVLATAKGRCALCRQADSDVRLEVDHIVPRSKGGSNTESNLQVLCDRCNRESPTSTRPTSVFPPRLIDNGAATEGRTVLTVELAAVLRSGYSIFECIDLAWSPC